MDDIDRAQMRVLNDTAAAIAKAARDIPPGEPGEKHMSSNDIKK